jgi:hypothetical protein
MRLKFNPFLGQLQYVGVSGPGNGNSSANAIATWTDSTGESIQSTPAIADSTGFVFSQGNVIQNNVPANYELTIESTEQMIVMGDYFMFGSILCEGKMLIIGG